MNPLEEIKIITAQMNREELSMFRDWFDKFDSEAWDRPFEEDVLAGRLDALAEEALDDLKEGRCTAL